MSSMLKQLLIGQPLASERLAHERLGKFQALAVLSSDALSSVAYASEEILLVLVLAGSGALGLSLPIGLAIGLLLVIVALSYYQTVHAYPTGGGAYTVARENLGPLPGLIAGAALLNDYVLTVAVSVSAGVAAITSALPELYPWGVALALGTVAFVTLVNLRGIRESGRVFALPTYFFIATLFALVVAGLVRLYVGGAPMTPSTPVPATASLTAFLVLRAFSSGCTALTGVEAISNGVPVFKAPESVNAGKTLLWMAGILVSMFLGITFLAHSYHLVPAHGETLVSQLARIVFGAGPFYYAVQAATALILLLAANTSYADFPRLAMWMARDRYLPRPLANLGDRLVFGNGILLLGGVASILIVIFRADTHALIPLYAVGVFTAFTISQSGMVHHWLKLRTPGWQRSAAINGLGALTTGVVLVVIAGSKFVLGAWMVLVLIPAMVRIFLAIHHHYDETAQQLSLAGRWPVPVHRHTVIVPVAGLHRGTLKAVEYAQALGGDLHTVNIATDDRESAALSDRWQDILPDVPLEVIPSPYRSVLVPLLEYIEGFVKEEGDYVTVVVPEFVPTMWWHRFLHNQTAHLLRRELLRRRTGWQGRFRILTNVPFYLTR
jgi:amino acid transporter